MDGAMGGMPGMPGDEHGGNGGHGDLDMQCSMSMVWNTATRGMCIVFPSWRVTGPASLLVTLIVLFLLAVLLEYLRFCIRTLDAHLLLTHNLTSGLLDGLHGGGGAHRRKASVQRVHGGANGHSTAGTSDLGALGGLYSGSSSPSSRNSPHPGRSSSRAGPTLVPSAAALGIGRPSDSSSAGSRSDDDAPLLPGGGAAANRRRRKGMGLLGHDRLGDNVIPRLPIPRSGQTRRTGLYVASVALSMFLMLVFMTYNAWLIAAVLSGAGAGFFLFNRDLGLGRLADDKGAACH